MGATLKKSRSVPENKFEDYLLTYDSGPSAGLFDVSNSAMEYATNKVAGFTTSAAAPGADNAESIIDIGFDFKMDGNSYRQLIVDVNGWCCLIDPNYTFSLTDILTLGFPGSNNLIRDDIAHTDILLAPWFDDLRNCWRYSNDSWLTNTASDYLTSMSTTQSNVTNGITTYPPGMDSSLGGIKYYRGYTAQLGRCLIVRWKSFASYASSNTIISFDVALYESGVVEFRYAPNAYTRVDAYESATVGIFAHGGTIGKPRYRDFGGVLKPDSRGIYVNGGCVYDNLFLDNSKKYTNTLTVPRHFPGSEKFGAVFRFSPPKYRRRQNRSVISLRDAEPFVRSFGDTSYFDDQQTFPNSIPGVTSSYEYPSMLPVDAKIASFGGRDVAAGLFQSGSIVVSRTGVTTRLYDDVLRDAILDLRKKS